MKKETIPIGFLFDEIDVDSYLKKNFRTFSLYKIELAGLVKVSLEKLNKSKSFLLNQVLDIRASKLRLNYPDNENFFFILKYLKMMKESYDKISKTLFIPMTMKTNPTVPKPD